MNEVCNLVKKSCGNDRHRRQRGKGERMKVQQIVNVIDTYSLYKAKLHRDKSALQWELMSTGETDKTLKLRRQIKADEFSLEEYLKEDV